MAEADLLAEVRALDGRVADNTRALPPADEEEQGPQARVQRIAARRTPRFARPRLLRLAHWLSGRAGDAAGLAGGRPLTRKRATDSARQSSAASPKAATRMIPLSIAVMPADSRQQRVAVGGATPLPP